MPFKVQPTKLSDVPALASIYFAAFSTNLFGRVCFPDTPAVRRWWCDSIAHELQHQPGAAFYNLVEYADGTATPTFSASSASARIVAFAKWLRPMQGTSPASTVQHPADLPADCDAALFHAYFPELTKRHEACMGTKPHWYLELLATHPAHQRRGAATRLIEHVLTANPDNAQYDAYLEASPEGLSTYRRLGFERRDAFVVTIEGQEYETLMMVRPGKVMTGSK
ncbi:hypothetical protein MPH_03755 [Macrophomina phaseolina MS6]|uniref:N-acetyltransferase domain-containing protein n=2 Tax=Macrophomina phaseolina TaxID=35725 RepID=K2SQY2_MACPH|nr:hypothetical protein MPH_03755 [Macrophomina phaseolina MS6]KAH7054238.1 acyl-CoA N-acyltransferase [Macrophomina phaseolina]